MLGLAAEDQVPTESKPVRLSDAVVTGTNTWRVFLYH